MHYYSRGSAIQGPVSADEITRLIQQGTITRDAMTWNDKLPDWIPILESFFSAAFPAPTTAFQKAHAYPALQPAAQIASSFGGAALLVDTALPPPGGSNSAYGRPASQELPNEANRQPENVPYNPYGSASRDPYAPPRPIKERPYIPPSKPLTWVQILWSSKGRIPRRQYWGAQAIMVLSAFAVTILLPMMVPAATRRTPGFQPEHVIPLLLGMLYFILLVWAGITLTAKRWQDRGKPGWMVLVGFIPVIGPCWTLIECGFLRGTQGQNAYGSDPT